jgi:hypothetical protein
MQLLKWSLKPLEDSTPLPILLRVKLMTTQHHHNPSRWIRPICIALTCSILAACGGGGGGSTGGSNGGGGSDSSHGVRVLHASVDAAPVDVVSSTGSSPLVSQQFFAGNKGYRALPDGSQVLSLTRTLNPADVLATFSVVATSNSRYSILFFGDLQNIGLRTRLIEDDVPAELSGSAVRVVNGVVGAAALQVSITSADPQLVGFGQNSEYIVTSPGEVRVEARRAADGLPAGSLVVNAQADRAYTVLFAGEAGFYTKAVVFNDR